MIIPTAEYNPMFAQDGVPFREKMTAYIQREFSDLLGPRAGLLGSDHGLEALAAMYEPAPIRGSVGRRAA